MPASHNVSLNRTDPPAAEEIPWLTAEAVRAVYGDGHAAGYAEGYAAALAAQQGPQLTVIAGGKTG